MSDVIARIEDCGFSCEAGPLQNCQDWIRLKQEVARLRTTLTNIANPGHPIIADGRSLARVYEDMARDALEAPEGAKSHWYYLPPQERS